MPGNLVDKCRLDLCHLRKYPWNYAQSDKVFEVGLWMVGFSAAFLREKCFKKCLGEKKSRVVFATQGMNGLVVSMRSK